MCAVARGRNSFALVGVRREANDKQRPRLGKVIVAVWEARARSRRPSSGTHRQFGNFDAVPHFGHRERRAGWLVLLALPGRRASRRGAWAGSRPAACGRIRRRQS
jgi:hypothetical protein